MRRTGTEPVSDDFVPDPYSTPHVIQPSFSHSHPSGSGALKQAGEEIWEVGIDDTYSSMKHQDDEPLGNAFDITWLTIVCIKLKEIKAGKKIRVRTKG